MEKWNNVFREAAVDVDITQFSSSSSRAVLSQSSSHRGRRRMLCVIFDSVNIELCRAQDSRDIDNYRFQSDKIHLEPHRLIFHLHLALINAILVDLCN